MSDFNSTTPNPSTSSPVGLPSQLPPQQHAQDNQGSSNDEEDGTKASEELRPFACPKCSYRAKVKGHLQEHEQYHHIGTVCMAPGCDVKEDTEVALRHHILRDHVRRPEMNLLDRKGPERLRLQCTWPGCERMCLQRRHLSRCFLRHCYEAAKRQGMDDKENIEADSDSGVEGGDEDGPGNLGSSPQSDPSYPRSEISYPEHEDGRKQANQSVEVDNANFTVGIASLLQKIDNLESNLTTQLHGVRQVLDDNGVQPRDIGAEAYQLDQSHNAPQNARIHSPQDNYRLPALVLSESPKSPALPTLEPQVSPPGPPQKRPADAYALDLPPTKLRRIEPDQQSE
ncbi:hypothetical protein F5Y13DRAFT_188155 [Hypoxylon sp. FL1857]|nr:hypothetical protein F5Y13DRAFT_188155 [Hypoxylon sp. FL1857]